MSDDLALAVEEALEHLGHAAELVEFACRETGDEYLRRTALAHHVADISVSWDMLEIHAELALSHIPVCWMCWPV